MNWREEHNKRIISFPDEIREAHEHSSTHRAEIEASTFAGCFYCCESFAPSEILDWVDEDSLGIGQTALCPKCGIDSVIGDQSGYCLTREFLQQMHHYWFEQTIEIDLEKDC